MTDKTRSDQLQEHLQTLASDLREAEHLDAETQQELADLMEELSRAIHSETLSAEEVDHLVATSTHLEKALEQQHAESLHSARDRLRQAMAAVETRSPVLASVTRRLIDALSNLGI